MKLKTVLLFLLFLQLGSCTQRYVFLKKVRVSGESTKAKSIIEKRTQEMIEIQSLETASADTTIGIIPNQPLHIVTEPVFHKQYSDSKSFTQHRIIKQKKNNPSKNNYTEPEEPKHNKYARTAFILSLLAIASVALLWALPFVGVLAIFIFGAIAQDYGGKALKQLKTSKEKGKWMAITGIIVGSLILSAAIAFIVAFGVNFSSSASDSLFYKEVVILALGIFALLMRSHFYVPKPKQPKPVKPIKPKMVPGPDNWNRMAIAAFVFATITILSIVIVSLTAIPIFGLLSLIGILGALLLGIIALIQIKSTHQKGKTFALIGALLLPIICLLLYPPLAILALLTGLTWWLIKRHKRKKLNKASLS